MDKPERKNCTGQTLTEKGEQAMAEAVFHAERQYTFCQFAQRKFSGEKAGILYDYYHVRTDLPCGEHDEEEMFEIIAGYFLHLKFQKKFLILADIISFGLLTVKAGLVQKINWQKHTKVLKFII